MSSSGDRLPFWLMALVAGAATFALVVMVGMLLLWPRWRRPAAPSPLPAQLRALQQALAQYVKARGRLPSAREAGEVPASAPRSRPTSLSRPHAGAPTGADLQIVAALLKVWQPERADTAAATIRLVVVNAGPEPARGVVVEILGGTGRGPLDRPLALSEMQPGTARELISTVPIHGQDRLVCRVHSAATDPHPQNNRCDVALQGSTRAPRRTQPATRRAGRP